MFAKITCPACSHKFSVPEAVMGKRQSCPNCQSFFVAGKSSIEPVTETMSPPMSGAGQAFNKTMLADTAPMIRYNCPACKKPLESPNIEGGTKKPCPACGQRIQVPAAPPPPPMMSAPPPVSNLNKTMLADSGPPIRYNCPSCKKPLESPSIEAGTKKPCPACGQRHQVPAASAPKPNLNKTMLASDDGSQGGFPSQAVGSGHGAAYSQGPTMLAGQPQAASSQNMKMILGAVVGLFLLVFVVPAVVKGGESVDVVALAEAQKELDRTRAEVDHRRGEFDRQKQFETDTRRQLEEMSSKLRSQEETQRENHRQALRLITDDKLRREMEDKFDAAQRKLEQDKRENEKTQLRILEEAKAKLEESKKALDAANQKQQQQQTIIQQPPVIYYPPYHPRYYYWW